MRPAARAQAAIEVIDAVTGGRAPEQALLSWARASRHAGSGDRRAVRDLVFDVVRRWRSTAVRGGGQSGRARLLGLLRQQGQDPEAVFTGERHAPAPLTPAERAAGCHPAGVAALDLPDWIWPRMVASLGEARAARVAESLRHRAPIFLRVNRLRCGIDEALATLAEDGIAARPMEGEGLDSALRVTDGAARLRASRAYSAGLVELQDASSQAVVGRLPGIEGPILDFCAGGGGKTLALAARYRRPVDAHDADRRRMADLPARAARAGARVNILKTPARPRHYGLVLCDAPCSGSGTWRRAPWGKWRLDEGGLEELRRVQLHILARAARFVRPGGLLVHATCSVLGEENGDIVNAFLAAPPEGGWEHAGGMDSLPGPDGDGFFAACLRRLS